MKSASASRPLLSDEEVHAKVQAMGQQHLLSYFQTLSPREKDNLKRQVTYLDPDLFQRQRVIFALVLF